MIKLNKLLNEMNSKLGKPISIRKKVESVIESELSEEEKAKTIKQMNENKQYWSMF